MRQSVYGILIGAAALLTSSVAFAGEQHLEFKLVTRWVNPTVVEAPNIEGQTMSASKAVGVAYFKDGRVASKDFIVTADLHNGSGPLKGYSTYTFEDGSTITASFTGSARLARCTAFIRSSRAPAPMPMLPALAASTVSRRSSRTPFSTTVSSM